MLHLLGITRLSTGQQFLKLDASILLYKTVIMAQLISLLEFLFLGRHPTCPVITLTLDHLLLQILIFPQCHYCMEQLAQLC